MAVFQSTQVKVDLRWLKAPGRFVLHFVEMWIAMLAGMLVFMAVPGVIALPSLLHQVGMAVAMTVPMVGWMRIRGHSWRHGIEMSIGMLAPWAAVLILVGLGADQVFPWLAKADGAAMLLGMLAVMLLRPHHYAHQHACHAEAPASGSIDPVCGMAIDPGQRQTRGPSHPRRREIPNAERMFYTGKNLAWCVEPTGSWRGPQTRVTAILCSSSIVQSGSTCH